MDKMLRIILWILTPVQKIMQKIAPPEPLMNAFHVDNIIMKSKPGDVLSSRESLHFTANFIKGFWKHSAIIAHDPKTSEVYVVEAIGKGVQKVPIYEWLYKKDFVKLQRRKNYDDQKRYSCGVWALEQVGKQYDFEFNKDDKTFYCSELAADALDIPLNGILEPSELAAMHEYLEDIYDSHFA